jgi:F-type H+-transporting ATPase subunit epsilon
MSADYIKIEIVTPENAVLSSQASSVVLPGANGEMEVLPGHLPLLTGLDIGQLTVHGLGGKKGTRIFFVDGGFAEVLSDAVTVITETCDGVNEIDVLTARTAIEDADHQMGLLEERLKAESVDPAVLRRHQDAIKRARMRLFVGEETDDSSDASH